MSLTSKVPQLRFREFSGEWEEKKLGSLTTLMQSGLSRLLSDTDIGLPVIRSNNLQNGQLDIKELKYWYSVDNQGANTENYFLQEEDLLVNFINSLAQIGKVAMYKNILNRNTIFTTNIMRLRFKESVNSSFIFNFFHTRKYINYIQSIAKPAVNQASFTTKDLNNLPIFLPKISEQQKIASFLSAVDTKIDQLTRKKELLEQYKKGVMQKIFSQELRFKADDGSEYPEWVYKKLGTFIKEYKQKSVVNDEYAVLTSSNKGLMLQSDYFKENRIVERENIGFNVVPEGHITYRSRSDNRTFTFNINDLGFTGIISTYYPVFEFQNGNNNFFVEYVNFYRHILGRYSVGTSQTVLSLTEIKNIKMKLPVKQEQTKIANFLSSLDEKLLHVSQQLDSTKQFKKALLQQMFV